MSVTYEAKETKNTSPDDKNGLAVAMSICG